MPKHSLRKRLLRERSLREKLMPELVGPFSKFEMRCVLCVKTDRNFAADIQQQMAASQSEGAKQSYAALTDNSGIFAKRAGTGAGASAGGVGGDTSTREARGPGFGAAVAFGPEGTQNNGPSDFTGVSGISGTSATTRAASSTSP